MAAADDTGVSDAQFEAMVDEVKRLVRHQKIRQQKRTVVLAPAIGSALDAVVAQVLSALGLRCYTTPLSALPADEWDGGLRPFQAIVGFTALVHFRALFEKYPWAKVVLPADTVDACLSRLGDHYLDYSRAFFRPPPPEKELFVKFFEHNFADLRASRDRLRDELAFILTTVPPQQLLLVRTADDWIPFCHFLKRRVPSTPFPPLPPPRAPQSQDRCWNRTIILIVSLLVLAVLVAVVVAGVDLLASP
jgi:hypothetical protein